ncbi:MAG: twin-arginine translocation signal domain-containing protein [Rhodobacteraceae bacterium]|nr:twin-arginine translocation signal domain-containing protein [Paracoccaceae bacterium]
MNRRDFLTLTAAVTLAAPLSVVRAQAAAPVPYKPGLVQDQLAKGQTVLVDFHATWCSTCAAQKRVMDKLRAANPAYDKAISFVVVDWDTYRDDAFTKGLKVTDRATLIVLKGDKELGRLNWETGEAKIKALMDTALTAATSA